MLCLCLLLARPWIHSIPVFWRIYPTTSAGASCRQVGQRLLSTTIIILSHDHYPSFVEDEWQCPVCYHENHPAKTECVMCGTKHDKALEILSPSSPTIKFKQMNDEKQLNPLARRRSFHFRRLNSLALNMRQEGARRRHMWKRRRCSDGRLRWVGLIADCRCQLTHQYHYH